MSQQTILVIGATGTVGAPVARQLREDGYQVRLLVRDPKRAAAQLGSGFECIQGSVEERETVKQALYGVLLKIRDLGIPLLSVKLLPLAEPISTPSG